MIQGLVLVRAGTFYPSWKMRPECLYLSCQNRTVLAVNLIKFRGESREVHGISEWIVYGDTWIMLCQSAS